MQTETTAAGAAEKPIAELTAAECAARLAEIERRRAGLKQYHATVSEMLRDGVMHGGLSGADVVRLRERLAGISADLAILGQRLEAVRARRKAAEAEEERAAAPARLAERLAKLDDLLDTFEAAFAEASAARAALEEWVREVPRLRELTGDRGRCVEPETLRRLGLALNRKLEELPAQVEGENEHSVRTLLPCLFGGVHVGLHLMDLLGPADDSALRRLADKLRAAFGHVGRGSIWTDADIRAARYRLLARGVAEPDADALAEETAFYGPRGSEYRRRIAEADAQLGARARGWSPGSPGAASE